MIDILPINKYLYFFLAFDRYPNTRCIYDAGHNMSMKICPFLRTVKLPAYNVKTNTKRQGRIMDLLITYFVSLETES